MHTELIHRTAIAVAVAPGSAAAYVRIVGDLDPAQDAALSAALERIAVSADAHAYIDLVGVTTASTALLVFLARVATTIAPGATALCRPSAIMRRVIDLAGLDAVTTVHDDLPRTWIGGGTAYT